MFFFFIKTHNDLQNYKLQNVQGFLTALGCYNLSFTRSPSFRLLKISTPGVIVLGLLPQCPIKVLVYAYTMEAF